MQGWVINLMCVLVWHACIARLGPTVKCKINASSTPSPQVIPPCPLGDHQRGKSQLITQLPFPCSLFSLLYPFPLSIANNYPTFPSNNFLSLHSQLYHFPLFVIDIYPRFLLLTTFFPCFLGYILFPCLLQIVILPFLLTTFFPCFLGYILFPCLLQIVILSFLLTTFFPCFFGYIFFPCLLQTTILPFSTSPFSLHFISYNPKLGQPHTSIIISKLQ